MTLNPYVPIVGLLILGALFALFSVSIAPIVGPKRYNRAKLEAYECGIEPAPQPIGGGRFPVKFYLTAMLFIIFDIETIFLYPWAMSFEALGVFGFVRLHRLHLRVATRRPQLGLINYGNRREAA
jgi:NADH-quinone oxidoreductase subunit A